MLGRWTWTKACWLLALAYPSPVRTSESLQGPSTSCVTLDSKHILLQRLSVHLALRDFKGAFALLHDAPWLMGEREGLVKVFELLAATHNFPEMQRVWAERPQGFCLPAQTIEAVAWEVVQYAAQSQHPKLRFEATLAGVMSQDAKGVGILEKMLADTHQGVQAFALECAPFFSDERVQKRLESLVYEGSTEVQLQAARALAFQEAPAANRALQFLLGNETLSEVDQAQIAFLIGRLSKEVDCAWVQECCSNANPLVRAIAPSAVLNTPTPESLNALLPLLADTSNLVRTQAIQTLGLWQARIPEGGAAIRTRCLDLLSDPCPKLAAVAAWALSLSLDEAAQQKALSWLAGAITAKPGEAALWACACLCKTGSVGLSVAEAALPRSDPLCALNLAVYLLSHRRAMPLAEKTIETALAQQKALLDTHAAGLFSWIGRSTLPHHPIIPRMPESEDLLTRLNLVALRAYCGTELIRKDVEPMLKDRGWGVSSAATSLLFQELPDSLEDLLRPLLTHELETVRVQAALLLSMIPGSAIAPKVLEEEFKKASKDGKESLLIGFANLPFAEASLYLTPLLFDPSDCIRTRAAGALLASLYV